MKRKTRDGKEIDIKDMETSHIKNCIKAIKEWKIMKDYIEGTYGSEADEIDAWYVDRSEDREYVLDEFEKELNRREMVDMKEEIKELEESLKKLEQENKELKKELKKYKHYYDRDKEELMESCYALKKENDEMKNELAECHGLMDEIDYRKKEAKRLGWRPNLDFMDN